MKQKMKKLSLYYNFIKLMGFSFAHNDYTQKIGNGNTGNKNQHKQIVVYDYKIK